jgi:Cu(I)/Ag(I) efflux system membrane fusion protein
MMNPRGGKTSSMPGMIMPGDASPGDSKSATDTSMAGMDMSGDKSSEMPKKLEVNMDFTMQLNIVFDQYVNLKNAFVQSDVKMANRAAQEVQKSLLKVDMKLLTGDAHMKWMDLSGNLDKQLKLIISSKQIEDQRMAFSEFSNQFYKTVKTFGLMGKTAYYQFCPMAFEGKGAYWLSEIKDISNPYFGKKMIDCGETKETLNY